MGEINTNQTPNWAEISDLQVEFTQAKRMASMHLSCPWRGPMIHPESVYSLYKRASVVFMHTPTGWSVIGDTSLERDWTEITTGEIGQPGFSGGPLI